MRVGRRMGARTRPRARPMPRRTVTAVVVLVAVISRIGFRFCVRRSKPQPSSAHFRSLIRGEQNRVQRRARTIHGPRCHRHRFPPTDLDDVVSPLDAVHLLGCTLSIRPAQIGDKAAQFPATDGCELTRVESRPHDLHVEGERQHGRA